MDIGGRWLITLGHAENYCSRANIWKSRMFIKIVMRTLVERKEELFLEILFENWKITTASQIDIYIYPVEKDYRIIERRVITFSWICIFNAITVIDERGCEGMGRRKGL